MSFKARHASEVVAALTGATHRRAPRLTPMNQLCTHAARRAMRTAFLAVLLPVSAQAASQGTIGATSAGSIGISVTVPASVHLQGEAAPSLDMTAGSAAYDACLAGKGIDAVSLAAEGSGANGAFTLTDATGGDVAYLAELNGQPLPLAPVELAPPGDCIAMELSIQASDVEALKGDGVHAGVLTLIVTPE